MTEPWVLAVDLGTTDLKVGAMSLRGELLAQTNRPIQTHYRPGGGVEQDPDEWWELLRSAVCSLVQSNAVSGSDVAGVGITGEFASTVPVGGDGRPVGRCILWQDTRGADFSAQAMGGPLAILGYSPANIFRWIQITGGAPSTRGADPLNHELYLRNREPEVFARARYLMEPIDYLGLRLTGRAAATPASMFASWLTDNRPGAKLAYVPELIRRSQRDAGKLPELIPTGTVLGSVQPDVAAELGIVPAPVIAGITDVHAAFLGSGAVEPYHAHVTVGTTCWITCEVPFKKTDPFHQVASIPGLRPNRYLVVDNQETAGLCLQWIRDSVVQRDYDELITLASAAPAGSDGVMFTPWLSGERAPIEDRMLRAAFVNLSIRTGQAQMVRSVLEGVAFNARWLLEVVDAFVGRRIQQLRIQGGCARSDLWCQIFADILNRKIERVAEPTFHSLRGAGLFAAVSLGKLSIDQLPGLISVADSFEPSAETRATYERMYSEFKRLYGRLHGTYARLNRGAE